MTDWKEYKLGEILTLIGGGTPKTRFANFTPPQSFCYCEDIVCE
jgi:hypothetical protein